MGGAIWEGEAVSGLSYEVAVWGEGEGVAEGGLFRGTGHGRDSWPIRAAESWLLSRYSVTVLTGLLVPLPSFCLRSLAIRVSGWSPPGGLDPQDKSPDSLPVVGDRWSGAVVRRVLSGPGSARTEPKEVRSRFPNKGQDSCVNEGRHRLVEQHPWVGFLGTG